MRATQTIALAFATLAATVAAAPQMDVVGSIISGLTDSDEDKPTNEAPPSAESDVGEPGDDHGSEPSTNAVGDDEGGNDGGVSAPLTPRNGALSVQEVEAECSGNDNGGKLYCCNESSGDSEGGDGLAANLANGLGLLDGSCEEIQIPVAVLGASVPVALTDYCTHTVTCCSGDVDQSVRRFTIPIPFAQKLTPMLREASSPSTSSATTSIFKRTPAR
ncbi:hypothetical protein VUR80DRAFT_1170 [Thermomyces stellatus]